MGENRQKLESKEMHKIHSTAKEKEMQWKREGRGGGLFWRAGTGRPELSSGTD